MAGKFYAFLVGLGVLLMTAAGGIGVRLLLASGEPAQATAGASTRPAAGRSGSPTPSVAPTPAPPATTSPTPSRTPSRTPTITATQPQPSTSTSTSEPAPTATTPTTPAPAPWQLVWSDDFDDLSNWSIANDMVSGSACLTNRPANVAVGASTLTLQAQAEPDFACAGGTTGYTTARLTLNRSFTYGAFVVRASGPAGNATGLSAAVTLGGFDVVRGPAAGGAEYRIEWEAGVLRTYVNDALVSTMDTTASDARTLGLSLAVGAVDTSTALPAEFKLDYVRVYQR